MYRFDTMSEEDRKKYYKIREGLVYGDIEELINIVKNISEEEVINYIKTWKRVCKKYREKTVLREELIKEQQEMLEIEMELLDISKTDSLKL